MFERLNFLTVFLFMFVLTLACVAIVPPLAMQALGTDHSKISMISTTKSAP